MAATVWEADDVVQPVLGDRERALARLRVAVEHAVRVDARDPEREEPGSRLDAEAPEL